MKKISLITAFMVMSLTHFEPVNAQCSICAKTTQQLGDKPARGFNSGIIYLMLTPFAVMGYIGYKWFKNNQST